MLIGKVQHQLRLTCPLPWPKGRNGLSPAGIIGGVAPSAQLLQGKPVRNPSHPLHRHQEGDEPMETKEKRPEQADLSRQAPVTTAEWMPDAVLRTREGSGRSRVS